MDGEERSAEVLKIEAREEFLQHIEDGKAKMRALAVLSIVVSFLLLASYFSQLLLPFVSGTRYVRVDLLDPVLVLAQVLLIVLVAAWLYTAVLNYLFTTRLSRSIAEIRALEKDLERKIVG